MAKIDAGATCAFAGNAASAQAGSFPGNGGCFFLFTAPGAATIQAMSVVGHFNKATADANLCARSFAGVGSPSPLVACSAGDFAQVIPVANGTWAELGLYNQSSAPISLSTSNANNALFLSGTLLLEDPTPPALAVTGAVPAFVGSDGLAFHFAATDPESRAGLVTWNLDGAGGGVLIADGCADVFVCGTSSSGDFAASGLSAIADGQHSVTIIAHSAGGDSSQTVPFVTDHTAPAITSALQVDYATRTISVRTRDLTSGIASATVYADGTPLTTQVTNPVGEPSGTVLLSASIPVGARLDGAAIDVVAADSATPANILDTRATPALRLAIPVRPPAQAAASTTAGSGAVPTPREPSASTGGVVATTITARTRRTATSLTAQIRRAKASRDARGSRLRIAAGTTLVLRGRLLGIEGKRRLLIQIGSGSQKQRWRLLTRADGSYRAIIQPRVGGSLVIAYGGSAAAAPSRQTLTHLTLTPRIVVHFTATRVAGGFRAVSAQGRFAPAGGAHPQLVWQARAPGGRWQLVGGLSSRVRLDNRGHFHGRLELTFRDGIEVRLVYLPEAGASLLGATSEAETPAFVSRSS